MRWARFPTVLAAPILGMACAVSGAPLLVPTPGPQTAPPPAAEPAPPPAPRERPQAGRHDSRRPYFAPAPLFVPGFAPSPFYYDYGYGPVPYIAPPPAYYAPPPVVPPMFYTERDDGYWYYCTPLGAYFPDATQCPEQWVRIPAR